MICSYPAHQIQSLLSSTRQLANPESLISWLLIDSRKLIRAESSLFFALKGKVDSHQFIAPLYKHGVRNFIIEDAGFDTKNFEGSNFFLVQDAKSALQKLASFHRAQFSFPIIGITGSNGKTIVKDWLYQLLSPEYNIAKSPKSYNSQIGVPLSVWQLNSNYNLGIFEAGISTKNEMLALQEVIQPNIGILTNIKTAHDEGFDSREEKIKEKILLFKDCKSIIIGIDYVPEHLIPQNSFTWSTKREANLKVIDISISDRHCRITAIENQKEIVLTIPFTDEAAIENAIICWAVLLSLNYAHDSVDSRFLSLQSMPMRLELKQGTNQTSIINDSYSADIESLYIAVDFLVQQKQYKRKTIILSDIVHLKSINVYADIGNYLQSKGIDRLIGIGEEITQFAKEFKLKELLFFPDTNAFLSAFPTLIFQNESVLIKGGRVFAFEKIVSLLELKVHETVLEINLNAIVHNLNFYRSKLDKKTKIMAMVKAYSYGSGSFEIANVLEYNKVDYLAVAYVDEGVALRTAGINLPIMVMSPEASAFELMLKYQLEPEIYSLRILNSLLDFLEDKKALNFPIHLKLDTGMHRLGFETHDIGELTNALKNSKQVKVLSVFSHLAGSDSLEMDAFTKIQWNAFNQMSAKIKSILGADFMQHLANTAAILRFPELQYDMVRLGIGMYGVENVGEFADELQTVGTLKTTITQIRKVAKSDVVGYSGKGIVVKDSMIATVKIGYADGYSRSFGNGKGAMLVNGQLCKVIGNVCMDMCMLDVTGLDVKEGDEAIVFGKDLKLEVLAKNINTIPYEILTGISQRVKRIYYYE